MDERRFSQAARLFAFAPECAYGGYGFAGGVRVCQKNQSRAADRRDYEWRDGLRGGGISLTSRHPIAQRTSATGRQLYATKTGVGCVERGRVANSHTDCGKCVFFRF